MATWRDARELTIPALLEHQADARPKKACMHFLDETVTYEEMHRRSTAVANRLLDLGVGPGDRVAVLMYNSADMLYTWFATAKIGAIFVPINVNYRGEYLRHQLAAAGTAVAVVDESLAAQVVNVARGVETLVHLVVRPGSGIQGAPRLAVHAMEMLLDGPDDSVKLDRRPCWTDPNAIMYTAGTTGPSKGAVLTQNYLVRAADQVFEMRGGQPDDICYSPLPLFHLNAMLLSVLGPMTKGASGALDTWFSASAFWDRVRHFGATQVSILGSMIVMLWQRPASPDDANNPARVMLAVPVPADIHRAFEERFGLRLVVAYGLSEAVPILVSSHDDPPPPGYSGKPNPLFDVQLFDEHDNTIPVGEVGEIVCRPREPHVMFEGYFDNPAATAAMFKNLWFHTGDLGRANDQGFIEFVDRKKDYLRRRGENISSFEVERAIMLHPAVAEVAVHAVESVFSEDDVKACVVLKEGQSLSPVELMDHCVANMPYFAVPRYLEFMSELPKNPVGRVLKYQLRERPAGPGSWDREVAGYEVRRS